MIGEATAELTYTYDDLGRLSECVRDTAGGQSTTSYSYDVVGNRLSKTEGATTTTYTYNALDQLTSETQGLPTYAYSYDDNGNLSKKEWNAEELNYVYDSRNRLRQFFNGTISQENLQSEYLYDYSGARIARSKNTGSSFEQTNFLIDNANPTGYSQTLLEIDYSTGKIDKRYEYGDDLLAEVASPESPVPSPSYFLCDALGSTRSLANNNGTISESYNYQPFGSALDFNPSISNTSHLFTGESFDSDLSFYYLRARHYDPTLGRFTTHDPVEDANNKLHKYLYCADDPINVRDLEGSIGEYNFTSTLVTLGILTILTTICGLITTGSVVKHIGEDSDFHPDAVVINIGLGAAYRGVAGGAVLSIMLVLKTWEFFYFITGEVGIAPVSYLKKHQGPGLLVTGGIIWNMPAPSLLKGPGFTATWPLVMSRFAIPASLSAKRWAQIPLALARYKVGVYKNRSGVIQFSQSASGPAMIAGGFWTFSFGWTAGLTTTPRPVQELGGDIGDLARAIIDRFAGTPADPSPGIIENKMKSTVGLVSDARLGADK